MFKYHRHYLSCLLTYHLTTSQVNESTRYKRDVQLFSMADLLILIVYKLSCSVQQMQTMPPNFHGFKNIGFYEDAESSKRSPNGHYLQVPCSTAALGISVLYVAVWSMYRLSILTVPLAMENVCLVFGNDQLAL